MTPLQVITPSGPVVVHLAPRRAGGNIHWRVWHPATNNWRSGSTGHTDRRSAVAAAQDAVSRLFAYSEPAGDGWTLGHAALMCLRDRFPECEALATGCGLNGLPKHLAATSTQWYTYRDARRRLMSFVSFVGSHVKLSTADTFTGWCQGYLSARRAAHIASVTIGNDQRALSRLASWIMSRRPSVVDWPANPAASKLLDLPPIVKPVPKVTPAESVARFLAVARVMDVYPAVVLILSGLRPAGAARIEWRDIDLDGGLATIREKNVERRVRLNRWAVAELMAWQEQTGTCDGRVWPMTSGYLFVRFRRIRDEAGCPGLTMQSLRRHVSHRLYSAGVAPQVEAQLLGHSVQTAMRNYVDLASLDPNPSVDTALDFSPPRGPRASSPPRKARKAR